MNCHTFKNLHYINKNLSHKKDFSAGATNFIAYICLSIYANFLNWVYELQHYTWAKLTNTSSTYLKK